MGVPGEFLLMSRLEYSDTYRRRSLRSNQGNPEAEKIDKCELLGKAVLRQCTHKNVSTRGSPVQLSVHALPELYQNCTKTLSNCHLEGYFEREADSPKLLETLESESKGRNRWNEGSCLQSRLSRSVRRARSIPRGKFAGKSC